MQESIREQYMQLLKAQLGTLRQENEYDTDVGRKVFRGAFAFDESDIPFITLVDGSAAITHQYDELTKNVNVQIVGWDVLPGNSRIEFENASAHLNKISQDMQRCLFQVDYIVDGQSSALNFTDIEFGYPLEGNRFVMCEFTVQMSFTEQLRDPSSSLLGA